MNTPTFHEAVCSAVATSMSAVPSTMAGRRPKVSTTSGAKGNAAREPMFYTIARAHNNMVSDGTSKRGGDALESR